MVTQEQLNGFLATSGLDFEVEKHAIPNRITGEDSEFFGIHASDDGRMIHAGVKDSYKVIQYKEIFQSLNQIANITDMNMVSGGLWKKGAEGYVQIDMGAFNIGNTGDEIRKRVTVCASHVGRGLMFAITPFRMFCQNQVPGLIRMEKNQRLEVISGKAESTIRAGKKHLLLNSFSLKHSEHDQIKLQSLDKWLDLVNDKFAIAENTYTKMANIKIENKDMISSVLAKLLPVKMDSKRSVTTVKKVVTDIMGRYNHADGGKVAKDTAWNLYNAIDGSFEHNPVRPSNEHDRSCLIGNIAERKASAMSAVMELCSTETSDPSMKKVDDDIMAMLNGIV